MSIKRIIASILVFAFILTQSGIGTGFAAGAAKGYAQNLRQRNAGDEVSAEAAGGKGVKNEIKLAMAQTAAGAAVGFPLNKIDSVINAVTGWAVAKRDGASQDAGSAEIGNLQVNESGLSFDLTPTDANLPVEAENAMNCVKNGLEQISTHAQTGSFNGVLGKISSGIKIVFLRDHDAVLDVSPVSPEVTASQQVRIMRFDTDVPANLTAENAMGFKALYGLGIYHELALMAGLSEQQALAAMLDLYNAYSDEDKLALENLLKQNFIDSGNVFLAFLQNARGTTGVERMRWINWLIGQTRKDYAYDANAVRDCLAKYSKEGTEEGKKGIYSDECKAELTAILRETYDSAREEQNIQRIVKDARARRQEIIFERFGHVGHMLGSLFAASKIVTSFEEVMEVCGRIGVGKLRDIQAAPQTTGEERIKLPVERLRYAANRLLRLAQGAAQPSEAQLKRAINLYAKAIDEFRSESKKIINETEKQGLQDIARDTMFPEERKSTQDILKQRVAAARKDLEATLEVLQEAASDLRFALQNSPKQDAAYVFLAQRISRTGGPNIAYANELLKPYAGPGYGIEEVIAQGGQNVHTTPSYIPLELCDFSVESLPLFIMESAGKTYVAHNEMEQAMRFMAEYWARNVEDARQTDRQMPTLNVMTTQSYNMTRLIAFWFEEEMANYLLVRDRGLEPEVKEVLVRYENEITSAIEQVVKEENLEIEVEGLMESQGYSRKRALRAVMDMYADVTRAVPVIAVANKFADSIQPEVDDIMAENESLSRHQARIEALKRFKMDPATGKLERAEEGYSGPTLLSIAENYLRSCDDLAFSTARKEVIARHMLTGDITQKDLEEQWISRIGKSKGYNLSYTESRINLGDHQIESVVDLGQPIGPSDEEAAIASSRLFELINYSAEGVQVSLFPEGTEGHKTLENSISRDCLYALGNVVALTAQSVQTADSDQIIEIINKRGAEHGDRHILSPGEGYGGFCIPKDGLFLHWVQSLSDPEVVSYMGVDPNQVQIITGLVKDALMKRREFATTAEWQRYVESALSEYIKGIGQPIYIPNVERATQILSRLGEPRTEDEKFLRACSLFGLERSVMAAREINNLMPYYKTVLIRRALEMMGVPVDRVVVGIQGCYKPNVEDSRLATSWDIFLGLTNSTRRLDNMQQSVREQVQEGLDLYPPVGLIRLIDPIMTRDGWVKLKDLSADVMRQLSRAMTPEQIKASVQAYGADLDRWQLLNDHPDLKEKLRKDIYLLVAYENDIEHDVWRGIEGLDVLNLGVAHRQFEEMLCNLPAVAQGMRQGRPKSALMLVDGPAGAEKPVLDDDMIKEWISLGGTCIGISKPGIGTTAELAVDEEESILNSKRLEMERLKDLASQLRDEIVKRNYSTANDIFAQLKSLVTESFIASYEAMEANARKAGKAELAEKYDLILQILHNVAMGMDAREVDFTTWLVLGGRYVLAGKTAKDVEQQRNIFIQAMRAMSDTPARSLDEQSSTRLIGLLAGKIQYKDIVSTEKEEKVSTGLSGALKGAAESKAEASDKIDQRQQEMEAKARLKERGAGFSEAIDEIHAGAAGIPIEEAYEHAMATLGDPATGVSQRGFGKFIAFAGEGIKGLAGEVKSYALAGVDKWEAEHLSEAQTEEQQQEVRKDAETERKRINDGIDKLEKETAKFFTGGEISEKDYTKLGGKTGQIDFLATLSAGNKELLEKMAMAMVMTDITLAIELLTKAKNPSAVWKALAVVYDKSLNCHVFDYMPYPFSTNAAYTKGYDREELFGLFSKYYSWLYNYAITQLKTRTEIVDADPEYADNLFTMAMQANTPGEEFCYNYGRPRDIATLLFDLRALFRDPTWLPQVLTDVDPAKLGCVTKDAEDVTAGKPSVAIMYPVGNTTVAIHAIYAGMQHPDTNLFVSPFVNAEEIAVPVTEANPDGKQTVFTMKQGMVYLTEEEFIACGGDQKVIDARKAKGIKAETPIGTFIEFKEPILLSCIAPHFKHPFYKKDLFSKSGMAVTWGPLLEQLSYAKTDQPALLNNTSIPYPEQVNWAQSETAGVAFLDMQDAIIDRILNGLPKRTREIIIKPSKESGGRGIVIRKIREIRGTVYEGEKADGKEGLNQAVEEVYDISKKDDAVIQDFLATSPRGIVTDEFYDEIIARFVEVGAGVTDNVPLYSCCRTIVSQGMPGDKPEVTAWIMLVATEPTSNFGQGALMFELKPENFKPEFRDAIMEEMTQYSQEMMQAYEDYAPVFAAEHGIPIGTDLAGVPYTRPTSLLLDWMVVPDYDENGVIAGVTIYTIEQNIGYGQFYPHNAQLPDERKGEGVYGLIKDLHDRANGYRFALQAIKEGRPVPPITEVQAAATGAEVQAAMRKGLRDIQLPNPGFTPEQVTIDNLSSVLIMSMPYFIPGYVQVAVTEYEGRAADVRNCLEMNVPTWLVSNATVIADTLAQEFPSLRGREYEIRQALLDYNYKRAITVSGTEAIMAKLMDTAWQSPVLQVSPEPLDTNAAENLLADGPNMAVVCGDLGDFFQDEVYALASDMFMDVNVLGVHKDWLTPDGKAMTRAIVVDAETRAFREVAFAVPVPVSLACILHHKVGEEQTEHQRLSQLFEAAGIAQVNPYEAAKKVDSKQEAYRVWSTAGIAIPQTMVVSNENGVSQAADFIGGAIPEHNKPFAIVVKPDKGTEGLMAEKFLIDPVNPDYADIFEHIRKILRTGDSVIVQLHRGNIYYIDPEQIELGPREVTIRINVEWDGQRYVANTGFAQVAADRDAFPASRGRGGKVLNINNVFANLVEMRGGQPEKIDISEEDIDIAKAVAVKAAEALYNELPETARPKLLGVDLTLEAGSLLEFIEPIVLEANSRPAGLANSVLIVNPGDKAPTNPVAVTKLGNWVDSAVTAAANGRWSSSRIANMVRKDRPQGQIDAIKEQLGETAHWAKAARFRPSRPIAISIAGGRLRVMYMHPDMKRFDGPALQAVIGSGDKSERNQIMAAMQETDDGWISVHSVNGKFREITNSIPTKMLPYPNTNVQTWEQYEPIGTAMAESIMADLGYYTNAQLEAMKQGGDKLPPKERWVSNNLRSTVSLTANAIVSLRTFRKGEAGKRIQQALGRNAFKEKGLKICLHGDLPSGGFSSSSAVVMAVLNALNAYYELGLSNDDLINLGCQAEYGTGVKAGPLDQTAIQTAGGDTSILVSSSQLDNFASLGAFSIRDEHEIIFAYSVLRDVGTAKWSAGMYADQPVAGEKLTSGEIRKMTGKSAEIAALLLELPLDTTFFKQIQNDIITDGILEPENILLVYQNLRQLPVLITVGELKARLQEKMNWYTEQLVRYREKNLQEATQQAKEYIEGLFKEWREPVMTRTNEAGEIITETGIPLRAMVAYLYGEVAKNTYLLHNPEKFIQLTSNSQNGDRCFNITYNDLPDKKEMETSFPWEANLSGPKLMEEWLKRYGAQPFNYNAGIGNEDIDSAISEVEGVILSGGSSDTLNSLQLYNMRGSNFFRGLALIDLIDAMLKKAFFVDEEPTVSLRINTAGQGDFYQIVIDSSKTKPKEVKAFMEKAIFARFGISPDVRYVETSPGGPAVSFRASNLNGVIRVAKALAGGNVGGKPQTGTGVESRTAVSRVNRQLRESHGNLPKAANEGFATLLSAEEISRTRKAEQRAAIIIDPTEAGWTQTHALFAARGYRDIRRANNLEEAVAIKTELLADYDEELINVVDNVNMSDDVFVEAFGVSQLNNIQALRGISSLGIDEAKLRLDSWIDTQV